MAAAREVSETEDIDVASLRDDDLVRDIDGGGVFMLLFIVATDGENET
ncbi:MAG: hypothetical protein ACREOZ_03475 [Gloeomargaritales cyanobacterium]